MTIRCGSHERVTRALGMLLVTASFGVLGCAEPVFPRDPEHSLERVMIGEPLRVGACENMPWIVVDDDGTVTGPEAEIISNYADTLATEVDWTTGSESQLILSLDEGRLDMVIGGIRSDSPWSKKAALTRPHARSTGPDGKPEELVFARRLGENALLTSVERYLVTEGLEP